MKIFIYLLVILLVTQTSCKKDETAPATPDHSKYVGNYYGVMTSDAVAFTSEVESDRILPSDISGNQVFFNDVYFNIPISQPASFSIGDLYYGGANLNYYSNFNQIQFEQRYDGGITNVDAVFNGNKTSLPVTDNSGHPLKSQLEGTFILQIDKNEYSSGTNVSYIDTVSVSMSGYNPVIDNEEYGVGIFYTFYKYNTNYNSGIEYRNLYWVEDSLYLDYKTVPSGTTDTLHHIFSGKKM